MPCIFIFNFISLCGLYVSLITSRNFCYRRFFYMHCIEFLTYSSENIFFTISSTQFIHLCELVGIQTNFEFYYESSSGIFKKGYGQGIIDLLRYWENFLRWCGGIPYKHCVIKIPICSHACLFDHSNKLGLQLPQMVNNIAFFILIAPFEFYFFWFEPNFTT